MAAKRYDYLIRWRANSPSRSLSDKPRHSLLRRLLESVLAVREARAHQGGSHIHSGRDRINHGHVEPISKQSLSHGFRAAEHAGAAENDVVGAIFDDRLPCLSDQTALR